MANILDKIIENKKESLKEIKSTNSLDSIENKIKSLNIFLDFKEVITSNKGASLITINDFFPESSDAWTQPL